MVVPVVSGPPNGAALDRRGPQEAHQKLDRAAGGESFMAEVPVVKAGDREHADDVHDQAQRESGPGKSNPKDGEACHMEKYVRDGLYPANFPLGDIWLVVCFFDEMITHTAHARPLLHRECLESRVSLNVLDLFLAATLAGLSWTCSMVHYPLLCDLHAERASPIHFQRHIRRIFPLVGVLMAAELMVVSWRCWSEFSPVNMASLGIVLFVWAVTGLLAAPIHQMLVAERASPGHVSRLLAAHHVRTGCWTIRCGILALWSVA